MPRPKNPAYQELVASPRSRKLSHSPINIYWTDTDKFEEREMIKKNTLSKKYLVWLVNL